MLCKLKIVARFSVVCRDFAGRMYGFCRRQNRGAICAGVTRFLDKVVVPWVVRINRGAIFLKRGTILTNLSHYLSIL